MIRLVASFACLLSVIPAQGQCLPRTPSFLERVQAADGRVPHAWAPGEKSASAQTGDLQTGDLRSSALALLCYIGDGSTLRSGPHKAPTKKLFLWIASTADAKGRLLHRTSPGWLRDHALATYALCEAARSGKYKLAASRLRAPLHALRRHCLERSKDAAFDGETLLWLRCCARSLNKYQNYLRSAGHTELADPSIAAKLAKLASVLRAELPPRQQATPRGLAADVLERLMCDAEDERARKSLESLAEVHSEDPWRELYVSAALYRLSQKDAEWAARWKTYSKGLERRIVVPQLREGELNGAWKAFPGAPSITELTSLRILTLELYYRYCALDLVHVAK